MLDRNHRQGIPRHHGIVKAAIDFTMKRTVKEAANHSTGDQSASSATGDQSVACALGFNSRAMASDGGTNRRCMVGLKAERKRLVVGDPGEDVIRADVWYRADESGTLIEVVPD